VNSSSIQGQTSLHPAPTLGIQWRHSEGTRSENTQQQREKIHSFLKWQTLILLPFLPFNHLSPKLWTSIRFSDIHKSLPLASTCLPKLSVWTSESQSCLCKYVIAQKLQGGKIGKFPERMRRSQSTRAKAVTSPPAPHLRSRNKEGT
jgi:hypothetical protein